MRGERIDDVFQRPIAEVLEISRKVDPVLSEEEAGSGPSRDESESMKRRRYNLLHFLGGPEANKIGYVTDPQNFLRFEELLGAAQEYLENKLEVRGVTAYVEVRTTLAMIYANRKASHRPKPDPLVELSTVLRGTYEARPNLEPFEVEVFWLLTRNIRLVKDIDLPEVTLSIMDDVRIDEKLASIDPQFARTVDRHELLRDAPYPVAEVRVEVRPASLILFFDLIESLQEISPGTEEARKSFDTLASAMVFSLGEIAIDESHKKLRSAFSKYALNGFFKLIPWAELPPPLEGAECIVFSPGPGFLQRRTFRSRSEETEVRLGSGDFMDPFIPEFRYIDAILTGPTTEIQQTARKSLEWFHASMQEGRRPEAFLRNWIALELFLGEPGKTVEALTRRMAILCKASENPLPELEREVKRLYDLRSRLVHRGENAVSFREIADLRLKYVLSIQIAAALAADRKLTTMRELWDHIDMEYMRAKTGTSQGLRKDGPAPREDTGIL